MAQMSITKSKQSLYVETLTIDDDDDEQLIVTMETFIALFVLQYVNTPSNIEINFVITSKQSPSSIKIANQKSKYNILTQNEFNKSIANNCNFPSLINNDDVIIAGLCGVCRNIVINSDDEFISLLGFKTSCLNAPSEASVWTKFCEIDIVECVKNFIETITNENQINYDEVNEITLPNELVQFENHMAEPIRMHNIYKLAREKANNPMKKSNKSKMVHIESNVPISALNLIHKYAEGEQFSIADIILFPSIWLIWRSINEITTFSPENLLPLTYKWLTIVQTEYFDKITNSLNNLKPTLFHKIWSTYTLLHINQLKPCSLYKCDPKRYNASQRIYTKQHNIDQTLEKIKNSGFDIISKHSQDENGINKMFDWSELPFDALPEGGELPERRLQRKKYQLENLAREIIQIACPGDRIVDFCSGTGHLGIILAYKLPQCIIYLLENKQESVMRARNRVKKLKLNNVKFFQCNLDYFIGQFEIGTSLHACGVATDIVLMHCLNQRAKFVCCPCCYGGCHQMPHINYPRSKLFRSIDITLLDYMHIAHCADQAHDLDKTTNIQKSYQGQFCMDIVDTDRKFYAEENGYHVKLTRLYPEDCTPKNRLLIGVI